MWGGREREFGEGGREGGRGSVGESWRGSVGREGEEVWGGREGESGEGGDSECSESGESST